MTTIVRVFGAVLATAGVGGLVMAYSQASVGWFLAGGFAVVGGLALLNAWGD